MITMVSDIVLNNKIIINCSEFTIMLYPLPHVSFHMYVNLIMNDSLCYVQH